MQRWMTESEAMTTAREVVNGSWTASVLTIGSPGNRTRILRDIVIDQWPRNEEIPGTRRAFRGWMKRRVERDPRYGSIIVTILLQFAVSLLIKWLTRKFWPKGQKTPTRIRG